MEFYESIADHYDEVFPLNPVQALFVKNRLSEIGDKSIVDIGCGTGNLCIELAPIFKHVTGLDPDSSMLNAAKAKAANRFDNLDFLPYGMLDIQDNFMNLDAIICFGNTLVHLNDSKEISSFFKQAKKGLQAGGKLLVQIINYDRILDKDIDHLPTIENEHIKFTRNYKFDGRKIGFETILSVKDSGEEISNLIHLYPIRESEIKELLTQAGFTNISFYGNFKKENLTSDSIPLIFEAGI